MNYSNETFGAFHSVVTVAVSQTLAARTIKLVQKKSVTRLQYSEMRSRAKEIRHFEQERMARDVKPAEPSSRLTAAMQTHCERPMQAQRRLVNKLHANDPREVAAPVATLNICTAADLYSSAALPRLVVKSQAAATPAIELHIRGPPS